MDQKQSKAKQTGKKKNPPEKMQKPKPLKGKDPNSTLASKVSMTFGKRVKKDKYLTI